MAVGLALFFLYSLMSEIGSWNPAPSEGVLATLDFLGVVLLPWAAAHLWRVAGSKDSPNLPPWVRPRFKYAALLLLLPLLFIGCLFTVYFSSSSQPSGVTRFTCVPVSVINNIVVVDVTAEVARGNAELLPRLEGPRLALETGKEAG